MILVRIATVNAPSVLRNQVVGPMFCRAVALLSARVFDVAPPEVAAGPAVAIDPDVGWHQRRSLRIGMFEYVLRTLHRSPVLIADPVDGLVTIEIRPQIDRVCVVAVHHDYDTLAVWPDVARGEAAGTVDAFADWIKLYHHEATIERKS